MVLSFVFVHEYLIERFEIRKINVFSVLLAHLASMSVNHVGRVFWMICKSSFETCDGWRVAWPMVSFDFCDIVGFNRQPVAYSYTTRIAFASEIDSLLQGYFK